MKKSKLLLALGIYSAWVIATLLYNKKSPNEIEWEMQTANSNGEKKLKVFFNNFLEIHKNLLDDLKLRHWTDERKAKIEKLKWDALEKVEEYKSKAFDIYEESKQKWPEYAKEGIEKLEIFASKSFEELKAKSPEILEQGKEKIQELIGDLKKNLLKK